MKAVYHKSFAALRKPRWLLPVDRTNDARCEACEACCRCQRSSRYWRAALAQRKQKRDPVEAKPYRGKTTRRGQLGSFDESVRRSFFDLGAGRSASLLLLALSQIGAPRKRVLRATSNAVSLPLRLEILRFRSLVRSFPGESRGAAAAGWEVSGGTGVRSEGREGEGGIGPVRVRCGWEGMDWQWLLPKETWRNPRTQEHWLHGVRGVRP